MTALFRTTSIATKVIAGAQVLGGSANSFRFPEGKIRSAYVTENTNKEKEMLQTIGTNTITIRPIFSSSASKGINVIALRHFHADIRFPSFEKTRRNLNPTKPARITEDIRRATPSAIYYGAGGMLALMAGKQVVHELVHYKWLPADQQALAATEIDLNEIPLGENRTYEWRGKPIFVKHRTAEEIARERQVPMRELRDPERDEDRVQKDEWLVILGVCTHLGCVPIANEGEYRGYFCPCHGSHFDCSGRIRKGPAPKNMEIPEYKFKGNLIVVG